MSVKISTENHIWNYVNIEDKDLFDYNIYILNNAINNQYTTYRTYSYGNNVSNSNVNMPNRNRNYCLFDQNKVDYFVKQKENASEEQVLKVI